MPDTPGIAGVTRETDCVALIDKGTCNPESHRTEANKETVLNRHAALTTAIPPRAERRRSRQKCPSARLSLEVVSLRISQAAA